MLAHDCQAAFPSINQSINQVNNQSIRQSIYIYHGKNNTTSRTSKHANDLEGLLLRVAVAGDGPHHHISVRRLLVRAHLYSQPNTTDKARDWQLVYLG